MLNQPGVNVCDAISVRGVIDSYFINGSSQWKNVIGFTSGGFTKTAYAYGQLK